MVYLSLTSTEIKDLTVGLFQQKSERDQQKNVGASNISDPCTRHLAKALLREQEPEAKYWLGGKIGTAIHSFIESAIFVDKSDIFIDALVEQKISLGDITGYGSINSKPDLVLPSVKHLVDWKTSSRPKVKKLKDLVDGLKYDSGAEYTMQKYIGQAQLYAWGLNRAEVPIDAVSLVFINRDGNYENDIWVHTVPYEESIAVALWDRVVSLWAELQAGAHPDNYALNPECFKCAVGI
jgi:hypothetical protein